MNAYQRLLAKLTDKVSKVKIHNPKAHMGEKWLHTAMIVPGHEDILEKAIGITVAALVVRFKTDSRETPQGQTMSSEVTIAIGKTIEQQLNKPTINPYLHAAIGAAVLGLLLEERFIRQYRDEAFSEHDECAPYIIEATVKFNELGDISARYQTSLDRHIVPYEIADISQVLQDNNRNLFKDYDEETKVFYDSFLKESINNNEPWLQAANKLQQQSWRVNLGVLKVVEDNFDKLILPVPPKPDQIKSHEVKNALDALKNNNSQANQDKYNRAVKLWNKELASLSAASKNVERHWILERAKTLAEYPKFYKYIELDYRGRVYYHHPIFNFQGADLSRGMLEFGEGKRLGNEGLKWLAIHTANCFNQAYGINEIPEWCSYDYKSMLEEQELEDISVDKMTLRDREEWTWQNIKMILASTDKLMDCEKPVSFLAACLEWDKVIEHGEDTISHLPVAIDGSCNGYQHSAAIAKDEITGSLVSLVNQPVQSDLYLVAAQELQARMPEFFDARPDMKMKHIRKGIAKRAVMTRAYSAGKDKISTSMYRDCHSEGYSDKFDITMLNCIDLGSNIYDLIKDVCPGATKTMRFLQNLATYELGTFEFHNAAGEKQSKAKRTTLQKKKNALMRKSKKNQLTEEELVLLNEVTNKLTEFQAVCVAGNGSKTLNWETSSGWKVFYRAWQTKQLKFKITYPGWAGGATGQTGRVTISILQSTPYPNVQAFQSGISPNYIHSQDASHMAMVIADWDGAFGAVHDSFSAHAADIDELSKLTRKKFVELYDVDDTYAAIAETVLSPCVYDEELPEMGSLDIKEVLKSEYFFC